MEYPSLYPSLPPSFLFLSPLPSPPFPPLPSFLRSSFIPCFLFPSILISPSLFSFLPSHYILFLSQISPPYPPSLISLPLLPPFTWFALLLLPSSSISLPPLPPLPPFTFCVTFFFFLFPHSLIFSVTFLLFFPSFLFNFFQQSRNLQGHFLIVFFLSLPFFSPSFFSLSSPLPFFSLPPFLPFFSRSREEREGVREKKEGKKVSNIMNDVL